MLAQPPAAIEAASTTVLSQLEAFRRGDFDTAYTFASHSIQERFDRQAFERMVTTGYPEIARSASAQITEGALAANGHVYLLVVVVGVSGRSLQAVYELVPEDGGWKINGVVSKPDPGAASS